MGKYLKAITAGMVVGAAVGMAMIPQLNCKTRRKIKKLSKKAMHMAEDTYDNLMFTLKK